MGICMRNLENQKWTLSPPPTIGSSSGNQRQWKKGVAIVEKLQFLNCPPYFCHLYLQGFQDFSLWEFPPPPFFCFLFWLTE